MSSRGELGAGENGRGVERLEYMNERVWLEHEPGDETIKGCTWVLMRAERETYCCAPLRYMAWVRVDMWNDDARASVCVEHAALIRRWPECFRMTDHPHASPVGAVSRD